MLNSLVPLACPTCNAPIVPANVNLQRDVAFCAACCKTAVLSTLLDAFASVPPPSATSVQNDGFQVRIRATTRSVFALAVVPFMTLWSLMFVVPWYNHQIRGHHLDLSLWLAILFVAALVSYPISIALMTVIGKVEITTSASEGRVFVGVGPIGRTWRFDPRAVASVTDEQQLWGRSITKVVVLNSAPKPIKFGRLLSDERRDFVIFALTRALIAAPRP